MAPLPSRRRARTGTFGLKRRLSSILHRSKNRRLRRGVVPEGVPGVVAAPPDPKARRRVLRTALSLFAVALLGCCIAAGGVLFHRFLTRNPHFAIKEIRVPATRSVSVEEIRARTGVALGENLFAIDLADVEGRLRLDPWLSGVRVHRELPGAIGVEIEEREAACAVALGAVYLADARGVVFKRATPEEAARFSVVTGIARDGYVHEREASQGLIREGIAAAAAWQGGGGRRAAIGEIHVDPAAGVTLYTQKGGLAIKLGRGDSEKMAARLSRVDAVLEALAQAGEVPSVIFADQPLHPERVTVRLSKTGG